MSTCMACNGRGTRRAGFYRNDSPSCNSCWQRYVFEGDPDVVFGPCMCANLPRKRHVVTCEECGGSGHFVTLALQLSASRDGVDQLVVAAHDLSGTKRAEVVLPLLLPAAENVQRLRKSLATATAHPEGRVVLVLPNGGELRHAGSTDELLELFGVAPNDGAKEILEAANLGARPAPVEKGGGGPCEPITP